MVNNKDVNVSYSCNAKGYSAQFKQYALSSAFQPIISIPHRKAVGYEGLIRAVDHDGQPCSPFTLFEQATSSIEHLTLDRLCRSLHLQNFSNKKSSDDWLFINLDSQCLATERPDPGFMQNLFSLSSVRPEHIVIEILESEINDRTYLKSLISHFRSMGCLIAIDDFGAGHSNFDRIWELEPDIVKIDRALIERAATCSKVKRTLTGIVSLIHEAGSLVIIEGIETQQQALIAIEADADMVQGFYFAKPNEDIYEQSYEVEIDELLQIQQQSRQKSHLRLGQHFSRFELLFKQAVNDFKYNFDQPQCSQILFKEPRAVRTFVLDELGFQIGDSIESPSYSKKLGSKFKPLFSNENANWSNKPYHFKAIQALDKLHVSRLYLSVVGAHMCITVSQAIEIENKTYVLCCDLDWQND